MISKQFAVVILILLSWIFTISVDAQPVPAAERFDEYESLLLNKRIGLVVNQTSMVDSVHLIDFLQGKGVEIVRIFAPEHGLRGGAEAGEKVRGGIDPVSGIPVVSLYGNHKKPLAKDMTGLDLVVFDLQDVGARFYTYISTMHYVMEACAEHNVSMLVLDRPNPNGHYVDGPVLDDNYRSFVGMHKIPVVHGLTIGELANMINGENWLTEGSCDLEVVKCSNYSHNDRYSLPVLPSPNLPNDQAIAWYPSLCLLEGTPVSVGRGTEFPFQVAGYPDVAMGDFRFKPVSMPGKSLHPKSEGEWCYGVDLREKPAPNAFSLKWVMHFYHRWNDEEPFFKPFFDTLAGTDELRKQIEAGLSEEEIRLTWQEELNDFKKIRKQYLLYPDFE